MQWFVKEDSVVRKIWGKSDTILFVFAGSAAEFALNKAVDWLFFTGKLPADPLGRLFSTVGYARLIVFSGTENAHKVIDRMAEIHRQVEENRNDRIPAWAYRDVLYMLIAYSIRSYELLERPLTAEEKHEVYDVFKRVGLRMGLVELPHSYELWLTDRAEHLERDLFYSEHSKTLYGQYRLKLGPMRYFILRSVQGVIVPDTVKKMLSLTDTAFTRFILWLYKRAVLFRLEWIVKDIILPAEYISQVRALESK